MMRKGVTLKSNSVLLLVEQIEADVVMLRKFLSKTHDIFVATSLAEAISKLPTIRPNIIIMNLDLPDSQGLQSLDKMVSTCPEVPVIVWTGAGDAAEALHHGAENFILKREANWDFIPKIIAEAIVHHKFVKVKQELQSVQKLASDTTDTNIDNKPADRSGND